MTTGEDDTGSKPSAESYSADLITIDVVGFSRFTAQLVAEKGAGAAERVRNVLSAGFEAVGERLRGAGFTAVDSLGDGIVLARRRADARDLARLCTQAETAFREATGGLRIRAATASGDFNLCRIGGWQGTWETLATGPAVDAAHRALQDLPRGPNEAAPLSSLVANAKAAIAIDAGLTAEIRRTVVVFVAMRASDPAQEISLPTLHEATLTAQRLSEYWGGRLEKVSHDDKGILLNLCFVRARQVGKTPADSALDCIIDLMPMLSKLGLSVRFGVAEGQIYRGPLVLSGRLMSIVHGPTVNRSAKLTAAGSATVVVDATAADAFVARLGAGVEIPTTSDSARGYLLPASSAQTIGHTVGQETYGRDGELARLLRALRELRAGRGGLVMLAGAPGLGKTRLLHALNERAPNDVRMIRISADPKRASDYMFLWREVLTELSRTDGERFQTALSAEGIAGEFHAIVLDVAPDAPIAPSADLETLPGGAKRDLLERAIAAVVHFISAREPLAIVVDDAHWLDEASCTLLADVLKVAPQALFVLAHRDGAYRHLDRLAATSSPERLSLAPLDRSAIDAIVARTKPMLASDEGVKDQVFNLSGGNPFHAEQVAYWLNQGGSSAPLSSRAQKVMQQLVLDERLDGLNASETRVVRLLSVFDRPLRVSDLEQLYARRGNAKDVASALFTLGANGFIDAGAETSMRHRLLGDAVIARIPPSELASLNATAARFYAYKRAHDKDINVSDAIIAAHWRQAGQSARAAVAFGAAADTALHDGAHLLALQFYDDALALMHRDGAVATGRIAGWHAGSASAHWAQGDMNRALDAAKNSLSILNERLGGPRAMPRTLRRVVALSRRTLLSAVGLGRVAVPRAARQPLVTLSTVRAEMALYQGALPTILSANMTMLSLAADARLRARGRARSYAFLGHIAALYGRHSWGRRGWDGARRAGISTNDPSASSHGYLGEALWHVSFARWREARDQLAQAATLLGGLHDPLYYKFVETLYALVAYFEGDWEQCRERFIALHQQGVKQQNHSTEAWGLYGQAEALIIPGRFDEALPLLEQAEVLIAGTPDRQSEIICAGLRAQILFLRGDKQAALVQAQTCLKLARALPPLNFGSLEGFAAPAEIALRLALDPAATSDVRAAATAMIKPAIKCLASFAKFHPIAEPRLALCHALAERLRGDTGAALANLDNGLNRATALSMSFERTKLQRELDVLRGSTPSAEPADAAQT